MPLEVKESFDFETFKAELAKKTEKYADESYITHGSGSNSAEIKEQEQRAAELYEELLVMCSDALIATQDVDSTMKEIDKTLIKYRHGTGKELFPVSSAPQFYRELLMRVAKRA